MCGNCLVLVLSVVYQLALYFHLIVPTFLFHSLPHTGGPFEKVWKKEGLWSVQKYLAVQMGLQQHSV